MLKSRRKQRAEAQAQGTEPSDTARPAGVSNQAMLSMLEGVGTRQSIQSPSGGQALADAMRAKLEQQFGLPMGQIRSTGIENEPAGHSADDWAVFQPARTAADPVPPSEWGASRELPPSQKQTFKGQSIPQPREEYTDNEAQSARGAAGDQLRILPSLRDIALERFNAAAAEFMFYEEDGCQDSADPLERNITFENFLKKCGLSDALREEIFDKLNVPNAKQEKTISFYSPKNASVIEITQNAIKNFYDDNQSKLGSNRSRHFPGGTSDMLLGYLSDAIRLVVGEQKIYEKDNISEPPDYLKADTTSCNYKGTIRAGTKHFNKLIDKPLPDVQIENKRVLEDIFPFGGDCITHILKKNGVESYGWFTSPSQVVHEHGHHLENNLTTNDFANLHNFLRGRTDPHFPTRQTGWGLTGEKSIGYNAKLPLMDIPWFPTQSFRSMNSKARFYACCAFNTICSMILGSAGHLTGCCSPNTSENMQDRAQQCINNFFLQESNSESTSYATQYHQDNFSTEFVSTTAEFLATERGAMELIDKDPTRAAMFFYLGNKSLFKKIDETFQTIQSRVTQSSGQGPEAQKEIIKLSDFLGLIAD